MSIMLNAFRDTKMMQGVFTATLTLLPDAIFPDAQYVLWVPKTSKLEFIVSIWPCKVLPAEAESAITFYISVNTKKDGGSGWRYLSCLMRTAQNWHMNAR